MYQKAAKPLSIGKVLDNGIQLYRESFSKVFVLVTVIAILGALPNLLATQMLNQGSADTQSVYSHIAVRLIPIFLLIILLNLVFTCATVHRISAVMNDSDPGMQDSIIVGLKKFYPVILASIIYGLAVVGGSLLLIIPGIILSLSMFFFMMLIVTEDKGIFSSLKTSHKLVWGNWWRTSAVLLVPFTLYFAFLFLIITVAGLITTVEGALTGTSYAFHIGNMALTIMVFPLFYSICLVQLNDLKLRKLGTDLEAKILSHEGTALPA